MGESNLAYRAIRTVLARVSASVSCNRGASDSKILAQNGRLYRATAFPLFRPRNTGCRVRRVEKSIRHSNASYRTRCAIPPSFAREGTRALCCRIRALEEDLQLIDAETFGLAGPIGSPAAAFLKQTTALH